MKAKGIRLFAAGMVATTVAVVGLSTTAGALPREVRVQRAVDCATSIMTVLDYEDAGNAAAVDYETDLMSLKCLRIGGRAERDRDSGLYSTREVTDKVIARAARAYHVSQYEMADVFCSTQGC